MSTVEIAALVVAFCLAASRLLKVAAPLWAKLPKPVAAWAPVIVMALPKIAEAFGMVKTELDLTEAVLVSMALLVPGATPVDAATDKK